MLPRQHAWHHATEEVEANYGANVSWWDKLHGTFAERRTAPAQLGVNVALPLWRQLWWPFA
jgi:sterol desaturase/sphingolipid hydroxylase (fatty acid hydroxylase superfamily)